MSYNMNINDGPIYADVNYKILAFKNPSHFDEPIARKILQIFQDHAIKGELYLTIQDITSDYDKIKGEKEKAKDEEFKRFLYMTNWQKKDQDELDIDRKINEESYKQLKESLKILISSGIIKTINIISTTDDGLIETKKYYRDQLNQDLGVYVKDLTRNEIINYVLDQFKKSVYPYRTLVSLEHILNGIKDYYFIANQILYSLILENQFVVVPLAEQIEGKEVLKEYLIPGLNYKLIIDDVLKKSLVPDLKDRCHILKPFLVDIFRNHNFSISDQEIDVENKKKINYMCFLIIEARKNHKSISIDDYNLAQIILNCWLALEQDPLIALQEYPNIELDNDFLSPFLTRYINDFSHITDYLKLMKGFMDHLPQVITHDELVDFFKSKGLQKKVIESFLNHLPANIMSFESVKTKYVIAKGQIIKALNYLYDEKFYKNTNTGRLQFEVLAHAFTYLEKSSTDLNSLYTSLNTTPEGYNETKKILNESNLYRRLHDGQEELPQPETKSPKKSSTVLPSKKLYTPKDFEKIEEEDREALFKALNLSVIQCVDNQDNPYEFYIKRGDLTLEEARFFRGKPTYELICKRFNL